jgi:hypothetical protein
MSVILSDEDFSAAGKDDKCSVCGEHLTPLCILVGRKRPLLLRKVLQQPANRTCRRPDSRNSN